MWRSAKRVLCRRGALPSALLLLAVFSHAGCRDVGNPLSVTPRSLRDVPSARLSFRFEADVPAESLPAPLKKEEAEEPLASVRADFETRRPTEALVRTVPDPKGQRVLAVYGTGETSSSDFRIDLYSVEGAFIRNVLPPDLVGVFPTEVAWSPDGERIAFVGVRNPAAAAPTPDAAPTPPDLQPPAGEPGTALPTPTVAPIIPPVQTFGTEQIYVGDRDGFNLKPLTARDGLIYFKVAWAPDGQSIASLASKEDEWNSRRQEGRSPAGRPRLIPLEGQERLLDDRPTEVAPVWSPDGSKVATAFEYAVAVYDAAAGSPTGASIPLREPLHASSVEYDARVLNSNVASAPAGGAPNNSAAPATAEAVVNSFNPVVRLEWPAPETLLLQTAFVRFYRDEPVPITTYPRWHALHLSPQAALLGSAAP